MEIKITNKETEQINLEINGRFTGEDMIAIFARMELQKESYIKKVSQMLEMSPVKARKEIEESIKEVMKLLDETAEYSGDEIAFLKEK